MRFTLNVTADNSAFDDTHAELARILREISMDIAMGLDISMFQTILDVNGNDVGRYALKPDSYFEDSEPDTTETCAVCGEWLDSRGNCGNCPT